MHTFKHLSNNSEEISRIIQAQRQALENKPLDIKRSPESRKGAPKDGISGKLKDLAFSLADFGLDILIDKAKEYTASAKSLGDGEAASSKGKSEKEDLIVSNGRAISKTEDHNNASPKVSEDLSGSPMSNVNATTTVSEDYAEIHQDLIFSTKNLIALGIIAILMVAVMIMKT